MEHVDHDKIISYGFEYTGHREYSLKMNHVILGDVLLSIYTDRDNGKDYIELYTKGNLYRKILSHNNIDLFIKFCRGHELKILHTMQTIGSYVDEEERTKSIEEKIKNGEINL